MSLKKLSKSKDGKFIFELKGVAPSFANALRRTIHDDVPTMAMDDIEIIKNTSVLYDEIIAHRLGLIPLVTDLKGYELPPEDAPEGEFLAKSMVHLTLKTKGPALVLASELKSKDPKIVPVFPDMPIVKLLKGQEIDLQAVAVLNSGKHHVKWAPGLAWYSYKAKAIVSNKDLGEYKDKYPPQAVRNGKLDKVLIEKNNLYDAVDGVNENFAKIEYDPSTIVFTVEPWGQLNAKEIVSTAFDMLSKKFSDMADALESA